MKIINRILVLLVILTCFSFPQSEKLTTKLNQILSDEFFQSSIIAADIYDLTQQEYLFRINHKLLLRPASNMKLFTSIAALLSLGADYQFITSLYYDGEIIGSTLFGNLYIEGGCDPEFKTEDFSHFVGALRALGINSINGNIYADLTFKDSLFWGVGWMWDDDPSTDAPYLSALNINGNSISVSLKPGNVGQRAEVTLNPETGFFTINNQTITVLSKEEENFFITRDWFNRRNEIVVKGKVSLGKEKSVKGDKQLNVINPEFYFLTLFRESLLKNGISVAGEIGIKNLPLINKYITSLATPLLSVLKNVNKNSNNLSAEMVLMAMAEKYYGRPASAENGIKVINDYLLLFGHNPDKYRIVDGSGVSYYNLVTAELIIDMLKFLYINHFETYKLLLETLPIAGVDGTLEKRMTDSPTYKNVRAKTGTLSGINALSGYLTAANGSIITFSILIQNHVRNSTKARQLQDDICKILTEFR